VINLVRRFFEQERAQIIFTPADDDYATAPIPPRASQLQRGQHAYKYTKATFADLLEEGRVRLNSINYFRGREDVWIGDDFEGRTVHDVDDYVATSALGDLQRLGPGIRLEEGSRISNMSIAYEERNCFVYCLSIGQLNASSAAFLNKAPDFYDACVEVLKPERMCRAIYHTGTVDGLPLREMMHPPQMGLVRYKNMVREASQVYEAPSPFYKGLHFAGQREFRFALFPRQKPEYEYIDIEFRLPPKTVLRLT
jgi:hypothetical protein